jgi:hypothetical protein
MKTKEESKNVGLSTASGIDTAALPAVVDRAAFQAELGCAAGSGEGAQARG